MTRTRTVPVLLGLLIALQMLIVAGPAHAACHVAAFAEAQVSAGEGAGSVTLTVFLQGRQPGCEGTVDFATEDGTATAGADYEAREGTLEFVQGDDREETIELTILDDGESEGDEQFSVALNNPTGGISSTAGPATVTVADDDVDGGEADGGDTDAGDPPPAETQPADTDTAAPPAETEPATTPGGTTPEEEATPEETGTADEATGTAADATEDPTVTADDAAATDGGGTPWTAIVLGVLVVGGIGAALAARRR